MYLIKYALNKIKAIVPAIREKLWDIKLTSIRDELDSIVDQHFIICVFRAREKYGFILQDALETAALDHHDDIDEDDDEDTRKHMTHQVMIDAVAYTNEILADYEHPLCHKVRDLNADLVIN